VRSAVFRRGQSRMVVEKREDPNSLVGREPVHLAVFARPHLAGGLRIILHGDDREGVRERKGEWSRWADGLPNVARKERERSARTPGAQTAEMRPRQPEAKEPPANADIGRSPALAPSRGRDPTLRDVLGQNGGRNLRRATAR
jgi:hypothetical protein